MWKSTGSWRVWALVIIVYGAGFTVGTLKYGFLLTRTERSNSNSSSNVTRTERSNSNSSSSLNNLLGSNPVEELVQILREATLKTRRSESITIGRAASCKSRHLLPLFYNGRNKKNTHNSEFEAVFEAYSDLHRACINRKSSQNLTLLFFHSNLKNPNGPDHSSGCKFLVVEFGRHHGVGNKLLWLASAFLYSILTQRVILIDTRFTIDKILCEPFVGSSWKLPADFSYSDSEPDAWMNPDEFFEQSFSRNGRFRSKDQSLGGLKMKGDDLRPKPHAVKLNDGWDVEKRCFCRAEQAALETVEWVGLARGCLYFVPGLFAAPYFKRTLESLFPEMDPATHLLRHLVVPGDETWSKVEPVWRSHSQSQSNKVSFGAQVRYRDVLMFLVRNRTVNSRITRCAVDNGLLPSPSSQDHKSWMVFIASLFNGLHTHLQSVYSEFNRTHPMELVQLSSKEIQLYDVDGDTQALAEIISLSFSDSLATTPRSTFGYIAQSLGGMKPWLVSFGDDNVPKQQECIHGQSSEPCYQTATERSKSCRYDDTAIDEIPLPYVSKCQDDPTGYQLIST